MNRHSRDDTTFGVSGCPLLATLTMRIVGKPRVNRGTERSFPAGVADSQQSAPRTSAFSTIKAHGSAHFVRTRLLASIKTLRSTVSRRYGWRLRPQLCSEPQNLLEHLPSHPSCCSSVASLVLHDSAFHRCRATCGRPRVFLESRSRNDPVLKKSAPSRGRAIIELEWRIFWIDVAPSVSVLNQRC